MPDLVLWVPGIPQPQGSARAFRRGAKVIVTSDNPRLKPWRQMVTLLAQSQVSAQLRESLDAVEVEAHFVFARPKGHFGARGNLLPSAPAAHRVKPDLDKLCRSILDGLTEAGVFHDDAQVVRIVATKAYTTTAPGVAITVRQAPATPTAPLTNSAGDAAQHGDSASLRRTLG